MSFILDALRKSESERQRQSGPGLVDAGYRPPASRRGIWLPVLVAVLVANLALMAYVWRRQSAPPAASAPPPVATSPGASAPTAVPASMPPPVGGNQAAAASIESEYAAMADLPAVDAAPVTEMLESPPAAGAVEPDAAAGASGAAPSHILKETMPSAEQMIANGSLSGTAMHLDIHVYSSNPAERFIFINMRKYTEGAQLPDGPRLEEITPEGAIFSINGQRFQLARD